MKSPRLLLAPGTMLIIIATSLLAFFWKPTPTSTTVDITFLDDTYTFQDTNVTNYQFDSVDNAVYQIDGLRFVSVKNIDSTTMQNIKSTINTNLQSAAPQGDLLSFALYTSQTNLDSNDYIFATNQISGISIFTRNSINDSLYRHRLYKREFIGGNFVFIEDTIVRSADKAIHIAELHALHFSSIHPTNLQQRSTILMFTSAIRKVYSSIESTYQIANGIVNNPNFVSGAKILLTYNDSLLIENANHENEWDIAPENKKCPDPCPHNERLPDCEYENSYGVGPEFYSCATKSDGCTQARYARAAIEYNVFDYNDFDFTNVYQFRDDFLSTFAKGQQYIHLYYIVGYYATDPTINSSNILDYIDLIVELNSAASILMEAGHYNDTVVTYSLQSKMNDVITEYRSYNNHPTYQAALDTVENDIIKYSRLTKIQLFDSLHLTQGTGGGGLY